MTRVFPIVLLASVMLAACRSQPVAPRATETQPAMQSAPAVAAAELSKPRDLDTTASVRSGDSQARTVPYRVRQQDSQWLVDLPGVRQTILEIRDGAQYVVGEREFSESVATAYSPALLLLPARLDMGTPVTGQSQVTITSLGGKPRDQGKVTYTIRLLGRQTLQTDSGPVEVYVVQCQRHMKLGLAEADVTITSRYRPGRGLIRQDVNRQTRVLGLIPTHKSETLTIKR